MTDKIICWVDTSFTHFGIAKYLEEQYDCELYSIIEIPSKQKDFFEKQELIKFKKNWFFFDQISELNTKPDLEYLSNFEKKYDVNLWLLAYNERLFFNYNDYYNFTEDEILLILEKECKLFEKILDEINPDYVMMHTPNFHYNFIFSKICMSKNIKILMIGPSRFGNRCILSQEMDKLDSTFTNENLGPERTHSELISYLNDFNIYEDNKKFDNKFINSKISLVKAAISFLLSKNNKTKTYPYYGRTKLKIIVKSLAWIIRENYRLLFINRNSVKHIDDSEPFIYFPLQINIESTLLMFAPFRTNDLELITNIVKSLPIGYKLYVKDHPLQRIRGWRETSFYKNIINLPNVKFIHHSIEPDEIMKKSSLVITVNSTSGFEAALHNKPTIILADTLYSDLPSVHRLKSIEELPNIIRTSLKTKVNISDVNKFVNYVVKNSIKFNLQQFEMDAEEFFYNDGFLVDQNIDEKQVKSFLEKNKLKFEKLTLEHINKLNQYKNN